MKNKKTRTYTSIVRQKQAEETKNRILDAAEELIKSQGYEQTTIGAIAQKAGVATQTVYAIFSSKQGILIHIMRRSLSAIKMNSNFQANVRNQSLPGIAKEVATATTKYGQAQISTLNSFGGFEILYPELYSLVHEASQLRRTAIEEGIDSGLEDRCIKLTAAKKKTLVDIMWAFTDNHLYYSLVIEAGWPMSRFEQFFTKIMEMVMGEVAPEMLKSMEE